MQTLNMQTLAMQSLAASSAVATQSFGFGRQTRGKGGKSPDLKNRGSTLEITVNQSLDPTQLYHPTQNSIIIENPPTSYHSRPAQVRKIFFSDCGSPTQNNSQHSSRRVIPGVPLLSSEPGCLENSGQSGARNHLIIQETNTYQPQGSSADAPPQLSVDSLGRIDDSNEKS